LKVLRTIKTALAILTLSGAMGAQAAWAETLPTPETYGTYLIEASILRRLEKCPEYEKHHLVKQCCLQAEKLKIRAKRLTFITYLETRENPELKLYSYKFDDFDKGLYRRASIKIAEWPVENLAPTDQGRLRCYRPVGALSPGIYFLANGKGEFFPFMVTAPNPLPIPEYHGTYLVDRGILRRLENCRKKGERLLVNQCCFQAEKVKIRDSRPTIISYLENYKEPGLWLYLYEFKDFKKGFTRKETIEMSGGPHENAALTVQRYMLAYRQVEELTPGIYILSNRRGEYFSFMIGSPPLPPHASDIEDRLVAVEWGLYMVGGLDSKTKEIQEWRRSYIGGEWTISTSLMITFFLKEPLEPLILDNDEYGICVGELSATDGKPAKTKSTCDLLPGIYEIEVQYEERSNEPPYHTYREDSLKKTATIRGPARFEVVSKEGVIADFSIK